MTPDQKELLARIRAEQRVVCLHAFGQPLVDHLVEIIKALDNSLQECEEDLKQAQYNLDAERSK